MKSKRIIILSMFILAILLMGAASAEDNTTITDGQIAQDINVTFPEKAYKDDPVDIEVELPEEAQGRLIATVDEVEIYNETITNRSVKIPVTIPESRLPYIVVNRMSDYTPHKIGILYNDIPLNLTHNLKLMSLKPDYDYGFAVPQELLQHDDSHFQSTVLIFPYSARGTVEVYIDGVLSERLNTTTFTFLNSSCFNSLSLGCHTARIIYSGDDYYNPSDKTYNFTVVDMVINVPKNIVLEHDDCLTAKILNNTDGTLYVYVDSKLALSGKLDKNGEFLESLFKYVKCGQHEIEVIYLAKDFKKSKTVVVNVSYYVDCWGDGFTYGEDDDVVIIVPTDFNKDLITITIDGVNIDKFTIDNSGWIEIDTSKLGAGNHTLHFDFMGDDKYNNYTLTHNFTVSYNIVCPYWDVDDSDEVYLKLPSDAKGNLEVYIDNKLFKSQKLTSGKASIALKGLKSGEHDISAKYTGSDYNVSDVDTTVNVPVKVTIKASNVNAYYTDASKLTVKITRGSEVADGMFVTVKVAGKVLDGYANSKGVKIFKLPKLKPGKYTITIFCDGVKVTKTFTVKQILSLKTVKIKKSAKKLVLTATLKKGKKPIKAKTVTFKFKGKTYKAKTNKYGVAKVTVKKSVLKKLKVGKKCTYQVSYLKANFKKTAKVKR